MKLQRAVGIDLGTTNSAIAMLAPGGDEVMLYRDQLRRATTPSLVGWDAESGRFVTGWEAFNRRMLTPAPVASIKRKMGRTDRVSIGPHDLLPEEVSAEILRSMTDPMAEYLAASIEEYATRVERALITVPAYFDAPQIEATRRAGELAGLEVLSLVQEPTAAAMYYAWRHGIGDGVFLVYDLGGGTFDVSIIKCLSGEYQVVGIDGDNFLGGDDFDRRLAEHFRLQLIDQGYALDLDLEDESDRARFLLLCRAAQDAKEGLSGAPIQYVGRRDIFADQNGESVTLDFELSRDAFETLITDLVDQSIERCHGALDRASEAAGIGIGDVDHVLLVGGSTRVPLVRKALTDHFCSGQTRANAPLQDEPDTCVALGAAIAAANRGGLALLDESGGTLTISTPTYTHRSQLHLVGRFHAPDEEIDSPDSVAMIDPSGDVVGVVRAQHADDGSRVFEFEDIDLPRAGRHRFLVEPVDAAGEPLGSFPITLVRGELDDFRPTGGALSSPSVLAKDLYLEVIRDGRSSREVLLRRGTSLPASGDFRFYTADQSGAVILRLYQNRYPIRTIHLTIPADTPVGTPVDLDVAVDESMALVAQGEVAGQKFWAQVDPPPEATDREWSSIEQMLAQVDDVARALWGLEAHYFRRKADPLVAGIRETARTDPDKMRALAGRLEELLSDYHNRDTQLTPAWGRFQAVVDAVKRVVYRGDGSRMLGMSFDEWRGRLQDIEETAEEAYRNRNQSAWTKSFNQAQALWESLAQDEVRFRRTNVEDQLRRMHANLLSEVDELRVALSDFSASSNPETRELQNAERERLMAELSGRVESPARALELDALPAALARTEIDRLWEAANAVRRQYERLPTIGLVSR